MKLELVKAIVVLPGTVLVYVPAAILWLSGGLDPAGPVEPRFWIGAILGAAGFAMAVWTVRLFATAGEGTPAPWAPPAKLVVRGPYRYVRNPMISGVLAMLAAESLLLGSWHIALWMAVFFVACAIFFTRFEEPALERRFGESYRIYKANVPRWVPRWRGWDGA